MLVRVRYVPAEVPSCHVKHQNFHSAIFAEIVCEIKHESLPRWHNIIWPIPLNLNSRRWCCMRHMQQSIWPYDLEENKTECEKKIKLNCCCCEHNVIEFVAHTQQSASEIKTLASLHAWHNSIDTNRLVIFQRRFVIRECNNGNSTASSWHIITVTIYWFDFRVTINSYKILLSESICVLLILLYFIYISDCAHA